MIHLPYIGMLNTVAYKDDKNQIYPHDLAKRSIPKKTYHKMGIFCTRIIFYK